MRVFLAIAYTGQLTHHSHGRRIQPSIQDDGGRPARQ
jgi:hypothetical protein